MWKIRALISIGLVCLATNASCKTNYTSADLYFLYYQHVVSQKFNRFDARLIIKAVQGCTKDSSLICNLSKRILDYKINAGSESATILKASQLLEIDPVNNRRVADKLLTDLFTHTKDDTLRKKLKQTLTQTSVVKLKSTPKITIPNLEDPIQLSNRPSPAPLDNDSADFLKPEDSEVLPPKRLTIIFAN